VFVIPVISSTAVVDTIYLLMLVYIATLVAT